MLVVGPIVLAAVFYVALTGPEPPPTSLALRGGSWSFGRFSAEVVSVGPTPVTSRFLTFTVGAPVTGRFLFNGPSESIQDNPAPYGNISVIYQDAAPVGQINVGDIVVLEVDPPDPGGLHGGILAMAYEPLAHANVAIP